MVPKSKKQNPKNKTIKFNLQIKHKQNCKMNEIQPTFLQHDE